MGLRKSKGDRLKEEMRRTGKKASEVIAANPDLAEGVDELIKVDAP